MDSNKSGDQLSLRKVIEGRKRWRTRSNTYQSEKRKLQDQTRYLKQRLLKKDEELIQLRDEVKELKNSSNP